MTGACDLCGSPLLRSTETEEFPYGFGHILSAEVTVFTCTGCGFQFTDHAAEIARQAAVDRLLTHVPHDDIIPLNERTPMQKIPTIFERCPDDRSLVIDKINPKAQWVFEGFGHPYKKLDGTCCLIQDGALWKRREFRSGFTAPVDFILCERDEVTGKAFGWVPVSPTAPEDAYHREGFAALSEVVDGTYELIGPKIQGNPEDVEVHIIINHKSPRLRISDFPFPRTFESIKSYLEGHSNMEGIVFHHQGGRMAKIKLRDFGIVRSKP